MRNCRGFDKDDAERSGVFRDYAPTVAGRPAAADVDRVPSAYAAKDRDPRVIDAAAVILAFADRISR